MMKNGKFINIYSVFFPSLLPVADGSRAIYCHLLHNDDNDANAQRAHFTGSKTQKKQLNGASNLSPCGVHWQLLVVSNLFNLVTFLIFRPVFSGNMVMNCILILMLSFPVQPYDLCLTVTTTFVCAAPLGFRRAPSGTLPVASGEWWNPVGQVSSELRASERNCGVGVSVLWCISLADHSNTCNTALPGL